MPLQQFFDETPDLDWLFRTHLCAANELRDITKCAIVYGNEDCPDRVELFDCDDYRAVPFMILACNDDETGNLVQVEA